MSVKRTALQEKEADAKLMGDQAVFASLANMVEKSGTTQRPLEISVQKGTARGAPQMTMKLDKPNKPLVEMSSPKAAKGNITESQKDKSMVNKTKKKTPLWKEMGLKPVEVTIWRSPQEPSSDSKPSMVKIKHDNHKNNTWGKLKNKTR
jgi:hypothetical protein